MSYLSDLVGDVGTSDRDRLSHIGRQIHPGAESTNKKMPCTLIYAGHTTVWVKKKKKNDFANHGAICLEKNNFKKM